ncbi:M56 family metallopeptidase [Micromonospora sp. NBC_01813]|uniref:M56 family metallopeptidase n=1 Tax=Micromonospora sp. NBC_01813 TaxID=2975988 RepID=UPI002DD98DA5|nr:M56 family metallopeptidase [Micromonospora sp. NBC_01813]WSA08592.1 M56 family metallopeptidase [Micromonospora sp. NBC_01813]
MFGHVAWSVLIVPIVVLIAARLVRDRVRPGLAAQVSAGSAVAVAAGSVVAIAAAAAPTVGAGTAALAGGPAAAGDAVDRVSWFSWCCLVLLAASAAGAATAALRYRRALRAAAREAARLPGKGEIVVLPDPAAQAFTLPGRPGRIVVTSGMRAALDQVGYAALVAHEREHLRGRHHRLVFLTRLAAAANPLLAPVVGQVRFLVERAADEVAAEHTGDRRVVAETIAVAALAASSRPPLAMPDQAGALPLAGSRPGVLPRRVEALLASRVSGRYPAAVPVLLAVGSLVWTGEGLIDMYAVLAAGNRER